MTLYLSENQMNLVETALERFQKELTVSAKDSLCGSKFVEEQLFQLELLLTWFNRQRELRCG